MQPTWLVSLIYFDFLTQTSNSTFLLTLVQKSVFFLLQELTVTLLAANNWSINTYGFKQLTVNFGLPRPVTWRFIKADVMQPIIGSDFLIRHKLLIDLNQRRLIDTRHGIDKDDSSTTHRHAAWHAACWRNKPVFLSDKPALHADDQPRPIHSAFEWLSLINQAVH